MDSETLRNELLTSQWYGISPGNISYTGGNVGIGTNNPVYTLDVLGIVRAGSTVSSSIYLTNSEVKWRGDGTAHFSIFNQNSTFQIRNTSGNFEPGTAGSNLVTVTTSGNVGIGTVSPAAALDVVDQNNAGIALRQYNSTDGVVIRCYRALGTIASPTAVIADSCIAGLRAFGYNGTTFSGVSASINLNAGETFTATAQGSYIQFSTTTNTTTTFTEKMRISGNGNVGIGVTTIGGGVGKLWSANDVTLISGNYAGDVAAQIMAVGTTNPNKRLALMYDTTNNIGLVQAMIAGTGTSPLCLNAAGGNVGIGSAGPVRNLDVAKTTAAGTPAIEIRGSGGGSRLQVYGLNADAQAWMGLGTDMAGTAYEHSIYFPSANSGTQGVMTFGSYNGTTYSEKMRILVGGNVGVGTNNPQAPFHVYKSGGGGVVKGEIRVCSDDGQKSRVGMYEESAGSTWGCWMQYNGNGDTMEFGSKRNTVDTSPQMTISSTGTVNVPGVITNQGRPMSLVGKNNGDVTSGIMVFNSVAYNIGSMYNSSNGRWTAAVAGYYQFTYCGISRFASNNPNNRWNKNGSDFGWGATHCNFTNVGVPYHMQQSCAVIIFLAVNDFVEFNVLSDGFYGNSTIHNTACCIFLG